MSAVHCCQAATPLMKAQGSGVIVNISPQSAISTYQQGLLAAYSAAKAAVTAYTRYLAAEVGPFRHTCQLPGAGYYDDLAGRGASCVPRRRDEFGS